MIWQIDKTMGITEFIGVWKNKLGNILEINYNDKKSLRVSFILGKTGKPVIREYFDNKESVNMLADLDFYKSSLEVELWEKGKGFQLSLLYDRIDFKNEESEYCLVLSITQYLEDNLIEQYGHLFEISEPYYKRIKKADNKPLNPMVMSFSKGAASNNPHSDSKNEALNNHRH